MAARLAAIRPMPPLVAAVFGGTDPEQVATVLDEFCRSALGAPAAGSEFLTVSVGAVFGVTLRGGRRAVVKAHRPGAARPYLMAVQAVQRHLSAAGIPAPEPLAGPAPLGRSLGTAETMISGGGWADPHSARVRAAMAGTLARLAAAGRSLVHVAGLRTGPMETPPGALWPTPHDLRFDFTADAAGAVWIDRIAEQARAVELGAPIGDLVVGHTDWRVENLRFDRRGEVCAVYDWDSLRVLPEPVLAGKEAANFTTDWSRELDRQYPTIEEALAFIAEFEAARGTPFDRRQRRLARAGLTFALAYIARCEHSDDATSFGRRAPRPVATRRFPDDSARSLLAAHGGSLLAG